MIKSTSNLAGGFSAKLNTLRSGQVSGGVVVAEDDLDGDMCHTLGKRLFRRKHLCTEELKGGEEDQGGSTVDEGAQEIKNNFQRRWKGWY